MIAVAIGIILAIILILFRLIAKKSQELKQLNIEIRNAEENLWQARSTAELCVNTIGTYQNQIDELRNLNDKFIQEIEKNKQEIKYSETAKTQINEVLNEYRSCAFSNYEAALESGYLNLEKQHDDKVAQLQTETAKYEQELQSIKNTYAALAEARNRDKAQKEKISFCSLRLNEKDLQDIKAIDHLKASLNNPIIISKLIWTNYIQKLTTELCQRAFGSATAKVCGIYKLTNIITDEIYIGQSVDIATRWKTHIKCGLGIDTPSANKLYNSMQLYGVWNFTYELLEKCDSKDLDAKERQYIDIYCSYDSGLNSTRGNK